MRRCAPACGGEFRSPVPAGKLIALRNFYVFLWRTIIYSYRVMTDAAVYPERPVGVALPFKRHVMRTFRLAIPVMLARAGLLVMVATDSAMLGHYRTVALASYAAAVATQVVMILIGAGLLQGTVILVAQARGAGDNAACGAFWRRQLCPRGCPRRGHEPHLPVRRLGSGGDGAIAAHRLRRLSRARDDLLGGAGPDDVGGLHPVPGGPSAGPSPACW